MLAIWCHPEVRDIVRGRYRADPPDRREYSPAQREPGTSRTKSFTTRLPSLTHPNNPMPSYRDPLTSGSRASSRTLERDRPTARDESWCSVRTCLRTLAERSSERL